MTGQDPESLQIFAYAAVLAGIVELVYGLIQKRSPDSQGVSLIMIWGSLGWFIAAALCYFGNMYHWIMIPAFVVTGAMTGVGALQYMRSLKSDGNSAGNIVS